MPGDRGGGASSDSDRPQSGCQGLRRILLIFSCGRFADTGRTMAANSRTASAALEGLCRPGSVERLQKGAESQRGVLRFRK